MKMKKSKTAKPKFEDFSFKINGQQYWWASWYANILGYKSLKTFTNPIRKAKNACAMLDIPIEENFVTEKRKAEEVLHKDYRLSRFACYLIAMNADNRKPAVAKAQIYFADQIGKLNELLEDQEGIERMLIRSEIKASNLDLNSMAAKSGVMDFKLFSNEGYIGLYNQNLSEVKFNRNIPSQQSLYDFMGRTELAAHLFRITLTEEHLEQHRIRDEKRAIAIHNNIAASIRTLVKENTGRFPEELALEKDLHKINKAYKKVNRLMKK